MVFDYSRPIYWTNNFRNDGLEGFDQIDYQAFLQTGVGR